MQIHIRTHTHTHVHTYSLPFTLQYVLPELYELLKDEESNVAREALKALVSLLDFLPRKLRKQQVWL